MKNRTFLFKLSAAIMPLVAALAMSGPAVVQAAAPPIIVDDAAFATNCGKYDGKVALTNPVAAINGAASGRTVLICPGTYDLTGLGMISIAGKKLTIKRALTGPGDAPTLKIADSLDRGFDVSGSILTIDGLIIDGRTNTQSSYRGIYLYKSEATIKNTGIFGPDTASSRGILADATGQTKAKKVSVTASYIAGYNAQGVYVQGPIKLSVKSSHLDASDGGRVPGAMATGVYFFGQLAGSTGPTGSVSRSTLLNNYYGIVIGEASKVSITSNTLINNQFGMLIIIEGISHSADNNKVSGNTILNVPASGSGIYIRDAAAPSLSIKKTTIKKNTIIATQYTPSGSTPTAIYVFANVPALTAVNATISGNTFMGFPAARNIFNDGGNAGLKIKSNNYIP